MGDQEGLDRRNSDFWSELCGSRMARRLGIVDRTPASLRRYDDAYFELYPYLKGYVDPLALRGKRVLEIGLGYGTLGQYLAEQGAVYHGVDIAPNPVEMMRYRLVTLGQDAEDRVVIGSALELPFADGSFDAVVSIGCLHHTGDLGRSVAEVHRVLRSGGTAVVMVYNRHSLTRLRFDAERARRLADSNAAGQAAPHTDFTSRSAARRLFRGFSRVRVRGENFAAVRIRGVGTIPRERLLRSPLARVLGSDLYVTARK